MALKKLLFTNSNPVPGPAQSIQTGRETSLCSLLGLSLPRRPHFLFNLVDTVHKKHQESPSAPGQYFIFQAFSWSGSTQDFYPDMENFKIITIGFFFILFEFFPKVLELCQFHNPNKTA